MASVVLTAPIGVQAKDEELQNQAAEWAEEEERVLNTVQVYQDLQAQQARLVQVPAVPLCFQLPPYR